MNADFHELTKVLLPVVTSIDGIGERNEIHTEHGTALDYLEPGMYGIDIDSLHPELHVPHTETKVMCTDKRVNFMPAAGQMWYDSHNKLWRYGAPKGVLTTDPVSIGRRRGC